MSRQLIRNFIASQDVAVWASEVAAAVKAAGGKWKGGALNEMAREGLLKRIETLGQPDSYVIGRAPSKWKNTPEEREAKLREKYAKKNALDRAARAARGAKAVQRKPKLHVVPSSPQGITSEDFIAAGGVVEVLPGFQRDGVHAKRKPIIQGRTIQW